MSDRPGQPTPASQAEAYAVCERLAHDHYENFPVASRLLPAPMRPHVAALYAFARIADDFADEGDRSPEERQRLLDDWLARLRACTLDEAMPRRPLESPYATPVFVALGETIRRCRLPLQLFEDLISAFRQDTTVARYATWDELFDYCRRSANPVGRLVLRIAGRVDTALDRASDALCTALQLTNFWQDLERDWRKGRLYLPGCERDACGALEADLDARRFSASWRCALERAATRTRECFEAGRAVADGVTGRLGFELKVTWLGGVRILDRLDQAGFDVFLSRPALGPTDAAVIIARAIVWKRRTGPEAGVQPGARSQEPGA